MLLISDPVGFGDCLKTNVLLPLRRGMGFILKELNHLGRAELKNMLRFFLRENAEKVPGFARDFTCILIFSSWCLLSLSSTRPTVGFQGFRWDVSVHCPWSVPCYLTTGWDPVMCK